MKMAVDTKLTYQKTSFFFIVLCSAVLMCEAEDPSIVLEQLPSICESKCNKSLTSTETEKYCKDHPHLEMQHRCCMNMSSSTILGIDLQECGVTRESFASGIRNMSHLVVISLQGNPITKMKVADFNRNIGIEYLSLPPKMNCPGGNDVWENRTVTSDCAVCIDELDPCTVHNITCPKNSYCAHVGVNMSNCLCDKGYYGYKCMNEGDFPFMAFGIAVSVPTALISLLLWVTQRRHVKPKPKET